MQSRDAILTVGLILGVGLVCHVVADALRAPRMLVLLFAGVLLGPSVTGAIDVPLDSTGVEILLTLGVSFILFHGGLQLSTVVLGRVALGLGLLVLPGVILTALVAGSVAAVSFDVSLSTGLLIGAVLAPTDPAILIPLFDRMRLRKKVAQTVIAESAVNDPVGAVLALVFAEVVLHDNVTLGGSLARFLEDLAISTALGLALGAALALAVSQHRAGLLREAAPIAVAAVVAIGFFSIDSLGGSGYLGAFLAGLMVGNMDRFGFAMPARNEFELRAFVATVSEIVVMLVFITLGAEIPWGEVKDHLGPALVVVVALIVLARPLTVLACLLPDRRGQWSREEIVFLSWTRETGVVPAALAGLIVSAGVPDAELVVTTVALAVIVTLSVQSTTKRALARRLRLLEGVSDAERPEPSYDHG